MSEPKKLSDEARKHARSKIESTIAAVIHQLAGHVDDHEGDVGGCHRAAAAIVSMFPADVVGAREDLEELEERAQLATAHDEVKLRVAVAERDRARAAVEDMRARLAEALRLGREAERERSAAVKRAEEAERRADRAGRMVSGLATGREKEAWDALTGDLTAARQRLEEVTAENHRLRTFAEAVRDDHECYIADCFDEAGNQHDPAECECGGDECWRCAAAQAIKPPSWAALSAGSDRGRTWYIEARVGSANHRGDVVRFIDDRRAKRGGDGAYVNRPAEEVLAEAFAEIDRVRAAAPAGEPAVGANEPCDCSRPAGHADEPDCYDPGRVIHLRPSDTADSAACGEDLRLFPRFAYSLERVTCPSCRAAAPAGEPAPKGEE